MKQYRYTSQNFVPEGETGDADAFIDSTELNELRRLAGMAPLAEDMSGNGAGLVGGNMDNVPQAQERNLRDKPGSPLLFSIRHQKARRPVKTQSSSSRQERASCTLEINRR